MKNFFLLALAGLALTTGCKKDDGTTPAVTTKQVSGAMSTAIEVPALKVASTASGNVTGTYDPTSKLLTYSISFKDLTGPATSAHLHFGAPGRARSGNITFPFANVPAATSGTFSGSTTLTQMQADSLLGGRIYANIHTDNNRAGEIRADLTVK